MNRPSHNLIERRRNLAIATNPRYRGIPSAPPARNIKIFTKPSPRLAVKGEETDTYFSVVDAKHPQYAGIFVQFAARDDGKYEATFLTKNWQRQGNPRRQLPWAHPDNTLRGSDYCRLGDYPVVVDEKPSAELALKLAGEAMEAYYRAEIHAYQMSDFDSWEESK